MDLHLGRIFFPATKFPTKQPITDSRVNDLSNCHEHINNIHKRGIEENPDQQVADPVPATSLEHWKETGSLGSECGECQ